MTFACLYVSTSIPWLGAEPNTYRLMLARVKLYNSVETTEVGTLDIFSAVLGFLCLLIGGIIHAVNLDAEPATRSFSLAFVGASASLSYIYFAIDPVDWQYWSPLVLGIALLGLVVGVVSYNGDPQAELKAKAESEDKRDKAIAEAKEAKASWEKWLQDQKLKAELGSKHD